MAKPPYSLAAEFKPSKSAVFTLGSLLISSVLMIVGVWCILENEYIAGMLLFVPGVFAGFTSYVHAFKTSKDQDLGSGLPFVLQGNSDSYRLSADPRTDQQTLLELIAATASILKDRKPLPEAKGMVAKDGVGDESKKTEANRIVSEINESIDLDIIALEEAVAEKQTADSSAIEDVLSIREENLE